METITITLPASNIIPIINILMYNIYYCKEVDYDEDGIEQLIQFYQNELDKLKPIFKNHNIINYVIYDDCNWDYETYENYVGGTNELGFDMEG
jgi:hypothetical protein